MRIPVSLGLTGFSLIAVSYGMARFSWGLMLPAVARDITFSQGLAGMLAACSFAAYCLSIAAAPLMAARAGPRLPAAAAALCAAAGLLVLALAHSPLTLAAGLFIAGLSAGLASPALADAVSRLIAAGGQSSMNTLINAGTSAGIILSVPVIFFIPGGWRAACVAFSLTALFCLLPVLRCLPAGAGHSSSTGDRPQMTRLPRPLLRLALTALLSGIVSAAWWSFGPAVLQHHTAANAHSISLLWLINGGAGIAGALTGPLARRIGLHQVWRLAQCATAIPLLMMAFSHQLTWWFYPSVAFGGAGYVTLSGVLLVAGARTPGTTPATGVGVAFFMLAFGQVIGSVLFGQLYAVSGASLALMLFATLPLLLLWLLPVAAKFAQHDFQVN